MNNHWKSILGGVLVFMASFAAGALTERGRYTEKIDNLENKSAEFARRLNELEGVKIDIAIMKTQITQIRESLEKIEQTLTHSK